MKLNGALPHYEEEENKISDKVTIVRFISILLSFLTNWMKSKDGSKLRSPALAANSLGQGFVSNYGSKSLVRLEMVLGLIPQPGQTLFIFYSTLLIFLL